MVAALILYPALLSFTSWQVPVPHKGRWFPYTIYTTYLPFYETQWIGDFDAVVQSPTQPFPMMKVHPLWLNCHSTAAIIKKKGATSVSIMLKELPARYSPREDVTNLADIWDKTSLCDVWILKKQGIHTILRRAWLVILIWIGWQGCVRE